MNQTKTELKTDVNEGLRDNLSRREAYPAFAPMKVELAETHISWVFLLERDVFKVKKPVDLGFLDFRTLAQRRDACEAEVRLNARLSPQVYLGVVPVQQGADGRACFGGDGPAIDWAVHMVRLSDEHRADRLLEQRALSSAAIDTIAKRIVSFHAGARCDDLTSSFGNPAVIAVNVEENFAQVRDTIARYLRPEEADGIVRWQTATLRGQATRFEERMATGHVRDGHGDLRLEHIYLDAANGPTIIDCIEFNDRFRFADVCADLAFLSMDLAAHGRVNLAEHLIARYAQEANDFDLYGVVDFYESYRAFVRAKIAAMRAAEGALDEPTRQRAASEARRYFLLALCAHRRSLLRPALVAVGGVIASGKSTIAERLGDMMSAPVISADRTRKGMIGVDPTHPVHEAAWQGTYNPTFTEGVYHEVLRRAGVVLSSGRPVVINASFSSSALRQAARDLATTYGVPLRLVECRASPAACRARLVDRARQGSVSDGRLAIFDDFCAHFEPITELPSLEHIVLDTTRSMEESLATLRERLDTWPHGFVG